MKQTFNGKEIKICATQSFNDKFGGLEAAMYVKIALSVLQKHPVDMLVFEMTADGFQQVRLSGYDFITNVLDEKTIAFKAKSLPTETFWFKVDYIETHFVGTFLFPYEY